MDREAFRVANAFAGEGLAVRVFSGDYRPGLPGLEGPGRRLTRRLLLPSPGFSSISDSSAGGEGLAVFLFGNLCVIAAEVGFAFVT